MINGSVEFFRNREEVLARVGAEMGADVQQYLAEEIHNLEYELEEVRRNAL